MKINRLMQAIFVSGCVCVALPAFASSPPSAHPSSPTSASPTRALPQCGGDDDDDGGGDGDDGDDDGDDDGGETRTLEL